MPTLPIMNRWWILLACAVALRVIPAEPDSDLSALRVELRSLDQRLAALAEGNPDRAADAGVFSKSIEWALRYEPKLGSNDVSRLQQALRRGQQRVTALAGNHAPWLTKKGRVLRGFVSAVDNSTQPYGMIIPQVYDASRPMRLDVVLHGSSKPVGSSELQFNARFDDGDQERGEAPNVDYLELHPLGRVENCYRWAGETDVFEAIEAACRNYHIDRNRIVLRGMSMGASGTWHLGLKHPDRFVALGPYCGYVDTHRFSETPVPGFIRVGSLPRHQELGLHLLDSVDYAANAAMVPAIAAIGDQDVFFQAHQIMQSALAQEGLKMVHLVSPGTGHVIDPVTHAEQMRRIGEYAVTGRVEAPRQLRFVTWSLKYNRCHWLELRALQQHYARAEFVATLADDGSVDITTVRNITAFTVHPPALAQPGSKLRIDGREIRRPESWLKGSDSAGWNFQCRQGQWQLQPRATTGAGTSKRPGLQGPIDDAFTAPFLCVRGTGRPWNPVVAEWADASLRRFAHEWARYMRGDLPVKNDTDVTETDVRTRNLILFGDPGSNPWIRRALPHIPLKWSRDQVRIGGVQRPAAEHVPVLICASPLPNAGNHYLVINSGHTFHETEFAAFNYLLFPRLGDWALIHAEAGTSSWRAGDRDFPESIVAAGYANEAWQPLAPVPEDRTQ